MLSALRDRLCHSIANAEHHDAPFPHALADNVFPEDVYRELLAAWPSVDCLTPLVLADYTYPNRHGAQLNDEWLVTLDEKPRNVWRNLRDVLVDRAFVGQLVRRFPGARERVAQSRKKLILDLRLFEDHSDYALGPHTDAEHKLLTALFYLPEDDAQAHLGTAIYRSRASDRRGEGHRHYDRADFDLVDVIRFLPNRLFMFVRNDVSFHGVETIAQSERPRRLLIYNVYMS